MITPTQKYYSISLLILLIAMCPVGAVTINNTILNSTGLNTLIEITHPWYASRIIVDSNYIFAENLSSSNPLSVSSEALTFNLTATNQDFIGTDVPYFSTSTATTKIITSNLNSEVVGGSANITVANCDILGISYYSTQHVWDSLLTDSNFSCSGTNLNIHNIPYWDYPNTYLQINYNVTLAPCNLTYYNTEFELLRNDSDLGIDYGSPLTMLKNLSFKNYNLGPDISNIKVYVGRGNGQGYLNNPSTGADGHCYYSFNYADGTDAKSTDFVITTAPWSSHNYTNPNPTKEVSYVAIWCNVTNLINEAVHIRNDSLIGNVTYDEDGDHQVLEFNIFNEDTVTLPQLSNVEIVVEYWTNPFFLSNVSYSWTNVSEGGICILPLNSSIYSNTYIKHSTLNGFTHRYYLENITLSKSAVYNLTLYNVNATTGYNNLKLTTRHKESYAFYTDVLSYLQRYYLSTNEWLTVQMDKSGDTGIHLFDVKQKTQDYRFIFTDIHNNILNVTKTLKFICDAVTGLCEFTFLLPEYTVPTYPNGFNTWYTWSNTTKLLTNYWYGNSSVTNSVEIAVHRDSPTGRTTLCDSTYYIYHGSDVCNLTGYSGEVFLEVSANGKIEFASWINIGKAAIYQFIGQDESAFWTVGIILVIVSVGLFSPAGAMIALIIALIFTNIIGIFKPFNITLLIVACIVAIVIGMKVKK